MDTSGNWFDDFAGTVTNIGENIKTGAEDVRRATVYGQKTIADAQIEGQKAPLDTQLNWFQRNWFYGDAKSKALIVGVAVLGAYLLWKAVKNG